MSNVMSRGERRKIITPWHVDSADLSSVPGMLPRYFGAVQELRPTTGWRTGNPRSSQVYRSLIYRSPVDLDD
jgi:hypothetical protein